MKKTPILISMSLFFMAASSAVISDVQLSEPEFDAANQSVPDVQPEAARRASDRMLHDISTQNRCTVKTSGASRNSLWHRGMSANVDQDVLNGEIIAYQIRWFNGRWSGWYVPGVNDVDTKVNRNNSAKNNTLRRVWSYFYDHTHKYIICR